MDKKHLFQKNKKQFTFRCWSRKSYAIFSSINAVVKISVLSGTLSLLAIPNQGFTQTDTIKINNHLDIDEVVVHGERSPEVYSKVSRVVTIIPKESALRTPAQNLTDILEYSPGVDLRVRGKYGVQADLNIRGGSFDQNVVLLNGINISSPQSGHLSLTLPVDIESIEQTEILEGSSSRLSGSNAFSGAVNFVTTSDTINRVSLHGMYGEHNLYKTNITASLTNYYLNNFVAFSIYSSDGYTHNTDFKSYSIYYNGQARLKGAKAGVQIGLTNKAYGSNNFYSTRFKDQFEENTASVVSMNFETGANVKLSSAAYWNRLYDHFVLIRDNPAAYQNYHATDVLGTNMNASYESIIGKTVIGFDFRNESIHSTNLGFDTYDSIPVRDNDTLFYGKAHNRNNTGLFIEQSYHSNRFSVSGGGVYNFNTDQGLQGKFYPGIDMSYKIWNAFKVYASVNTAVRMPTFTDLFYDGPENVGNPYLKPEESLTSEIGLKSSNSLISGNLSVFYRMGKNIIDWNKTSTIDPVWTPSNITTLNTLGFEFQSNINTAVFALNQTFGLRSAQVGVLILNATKNSGSNLSNYALDYLREKITVGIDFRLYKKLYLNLQYVYQKRNGDYQIFNSETGSYETESYKPFSIFDTKVCLEYKSVKPYIQVANIFNVDYYDIGGVPQPGRWISGGISINLNFKSL